MKTLNGYEVVDDYARTEIESIREEMAASDGGGSTEPTYEVIFPETELTGVGVAQSGANIGTLGLVAGETYIVTFNATKYTVTARNFEMGGIVVVAMGNEAFAGGADTGEPFAMTEVDGLTTSIEWNTGDTTVTLKIEKLSLGQPDWNQNDPTASNYIENRPFYEGIDEIIPETELIYIEDSGSFDFPSDITFEIIEGKNYTVTWNGTEYYCQGKLFAMDGMTFLCVGNMSLYGVADTGEPFMIAQTMGMTITVSLLGETTATVKIKGKTVKKLDEKYLPHFGVMYVDVDYATDESGEDVTLLDFDTFLTMKAHFDNNGLLILRVHEPVNNGGSEYWLYLDGWTTDPDKLTAHSGVTGMATFRSLDAKKMVLIFAFDAINGCSVQFVGF